MQNNYQLRTFVFCKDTGSFNIAYSILWIPVSASVALLVLISISTSNNNEGLVSGVLSVMHKLSPPHKHNPIIRTAFVFQHEQRLWLHYRYPDY